MAHTLTAISVKESMGSGDLWCSSGRCIVDSKGLEVSWMSPYLQRLASGCFFFSSCFCSSRSFPAGREESSRVWCGFTVIVVRVVFTLLCMETLGFFFLFSLARIAVIGFLENVVTNLHFSWLFVQLNVERIDFVFFAQSHSSVAPHPPSLPLLQVWPWLRSRSVRFTRNKLFFFSCKLTSLFLVLLI